MVLVINKIVFEIVIFVDFEEFDRFWRIFTSFKKYCKTVLNKQNMSNTYYEPSDLRKFGKITEWSEELGKKFFDSTEVYLKKVL
mgnify:CR=1 FL=1